MFLKNQNAFKFKFEVLLETNLDSLWDLFLRKNLDSIMVNSQ